MALLFGANTTDVVDCGSGSTIDDFTTPTLLLWIYPTVIANTRRLATKEITGSGTKAWSVRNTGQLDFAIFSSGTAPGARSANSAGNILTVNTWWCVAFTLSSGLVPHIYLGTLTSSMVEVAYATQTTGTGTVSADASHTFRIGNTQDLTSSFQGRMAFVGYYNTELTLAELNRQRLRLGPHPNCRLLMHLGLVGAGTQPDWSGNGNTGTVTGATVADHVPLGPLFGWTAEEPYIVPAVSLDLPARPGGILQAVHRASRF